MAVREPKIKNVTKEHVEYDDGVTIPLPSDLKHEFFGTPYAKEKVAKEKERYVSTQKGLENIPGLGTASAGALGFAQGNPLINLVQMGTDYAKELFPSVYAGEGQEQMSYLERLGENAAATRRGRAQGREEIFKENPVASTTGKIGGIASTIATPVSRILPGGPVAKTAIESGIIGQGFSEKSLLNEPAEVGEELLTDVGIGAALGGVAKGVGKIAEQRAALRAHPERLAQFARAEEQAAQGYRSAQNSKLAELEKVIPEGVSKAGLQTEDFINQAINTSAMAGTTEGGNLSKFISTITEAAPENMKGSDIARLFAAVENRIAHAPQEAGVLRQFQEHLLHTIPVSAAENAVYQKFGQPILQNIENAVDSTVSKFVADKEVMRVLKETGGKNFPKDLANEIKEYIRGGFNKITPSDFSKDVVSGDLRKRVMNFVDHEKSLLNIETQIEKRLEDLKYFKDSKGKIVSGRSASEYASDPTVKALRKAQRDINFLRSDIDKSLSKTLRSNRTAILNEEANALQKSSDNISNAIGIQNPYSSVSPQNVRPIPGIAPEAPQVGRTAQFLETPNFYSNLANRFRPKGALSHLGTYGAVYGAMKHPVAAGVATGGFGLMAAFRGVTSPGAVGEFARTALRRGDLRFIVSEIAQTYPSYQNGIIVDPVERRQAVAQLENNTDIPAEDKAVLQAKINRGKSLEEQGQGEE